jgi:hypothetical protein
MHRWMHLPLNIQQIRKTGKQDRLDAMHVQQAKRTRAGKWMAWHAMSCKRQQRAETRETASAARPCRKWPRRERLGSAQVILVIHDPMHRTAGQVGSNLTHPLSAASVANPGKWPSLLRRQCRIARQSALRRVEEPEEKRPAWRAT